MSNSPAFKVPYDEPAFAAKERASATLQIYRINLRFRPCWFLFRWPSYKYFIRKFLD